MSDSSQPESAPVELVDLEGTEEMGPIATYMRDHKAEFWQLVTFSMIRALIDDDDPSAVFGPGGATLGIQFQPLAHVLLECDYRIFVDEREQIIRVNLQAPQSEMQPITVSSPSDVLNPPTIH